MSDSRDATLASTAIGTLPPQDSAADTNKRPVVCVFCGASSGTSPAHLAAARALATLLHKNNYKLVYGGGSVGLMGEVARTLVSLSGPDSVHGVIPSALMEYEQAGHGGQTKPGKVIDEKLYGRTTVVKDMHTRKQLMAREVIEGGPGSGFVALSGGYGTLEELMEITTWNQLGIHSRAIVLLNVEGYWDGLITWVKTAVSAGFVSPNNGGILVEALDADECIQQLKDYKVSSGRFALQWDEK